MGEYPRRVVGGDLPALTRSGCGFSRNQYRRCDCCGQNCSKTKQLGSSHQVTL